MIKEEVKKKLCENFRIAKKCSIIACVLAYITLFIDLIIFNVAGKGSIYDISRNIDDFTVMGFLIFAYIIILLIIPFLDIRYLKGKNSGYNYEESPYYSDRVNCRNIIIFNFTEYYLLIIFWFYGLFSGNFSLCFSWAGACGYMLFSRIFLIFATIYLIKNYNILKKEFKENPPTYVLKQQENKKDKFYQQFINVCGFKFFIKYYN